MSTETDAATARTASDNFDAALADARAAARYDADADADYLAPELSFDADADPLRETLASMVSPSTTVLYTVVREPDADEVDGAQPGDDAPRAPRTFLFPRDDAADDLTFRVTDSFSSRYGDKVAVETPAPWDCPDDLTPANDVIKTLDWDDTHRTWDDTRDAWTMDAHAVDDLRALAEDAGYTFEDTREDDDDPADLARVTDFADDGDRIHVRYAKKNGNGLNTYSGEVRATTVVNQGRNTRTRVDTEGHRILFEDDSGKTKCVHRDDNGDAGLYHMGQYPFMGQVVAITVEPDN